VLLAAFSVAFVTSREAASFSVPTPLPCPVLSSAALSARSPPPFVQTKVMFRSSSVVVPVLVLAAVLGACLCAEPVQAGGVSSCQRGAPGHPNDWDPWLSNDPDIVAMREFYHDWQTQAWNKENINGNINIKDKDVRDVFLARQSRCLGLVSSRPPPPATQSSRPAPAQRSCSPIPFRSSLTRPVRSGPPVLCACAFVVCSTMDATWGYDLPYPGGRPGGWSADTAAVCQRLSYLDQLCLGVRFFDLRVATSAARSEAFTRSASTITLRPLYGADRSGAVRCGAVRGVHFTPGHSRTSSH
jgi:hypothetical protein